MEFLDYEGLKLYNKNIQNLIEQSVQSASNNLEIGGRNFVSANSDNWKRATVSESSDKGSTYDFVSKAASTTSISLKELVQASGNIYIKIHNSGYDTCITQFDSSKLYLGKDTFVTWMSDSLVELDMNTSYIGVTVRKSNNSSITTEEIGNVKIKIEQGTKPTDWTPSTEDVDAAINSKLSLSGGLMTGPISFPTATQGDRVLLKDGDNDYNLLTYTLTGMKVRDTLYPENNTANLGRSSNYWNNGYVNTLYSYQINAEDSLSITAINNLVLSSENESLIINANDVRSDTVIYAPAFYETSDIRKKDIKSDIPLSKCYELIDKCQTIIYSLKDQTQELVGMIAQEIEEFFPEVVATDKDGFKSLAYDRLVVICFKVLKDVIKRLEKLENAE